MGSLFLNLWKNGKLIDSQSVLRSSRRMRKPRKSSGKELLKKRLSKRSRHNRMLRREESAKRTKRRPRSRRMPPSLRNSLKSKDCWPCKNKKKSRSDWVAACSTSWVSCNVTRRLAIWPPQVLSWARSEPESCVRTWSQIPHWCVSRPSVS